MSVLVFEKRVKCLCFAINLNLLRTFFRIKPKTKPTIMDQANTPNPGKGLGITGFVLSLVAIIGNIFVIAGCILAAGITGSGMGLMIGWTVFGAISVLLSFMGMQKSKAAGHKPGLAMVGLIIGLVAFVWAAYGCYQVHVAASYNSQVMDALDSFGTSLDSMAH